jgi:valyl-tRNA synthetase
MSFMANEITPSNEIPKQYDPAAAEAKYTAFWQEVGAYDVDATSSRPKFATMLPPPNVTGALHMGHALNGTIQDLLTRWKRMQGFEALWMPGTDHAGIATQAVVERRMLEEEGKTRHDIGREGLVERIWTWKHAYEKRILGQLKKLGASCDWRRTRFTLDEVCSKAVRETFFRMFRDGLIYRGQRLVNWDTYLQTAVADDEVYTEDVDGQFWTFNYPVVDEQGKPTERRISFSTTRPETMLGDTAVCVHPTDERYLDLIGKQVQIPLNGRLIPIIADGLLADKELGTGCVKVTPAHDPNDYACGLRNNLPLINIMTPDGKMNEGAGPFAGLPRDAARQAVKAEMERLGFFEKVEDRKIPLKFSDRSKTAIEPYLSDQWFVKMDSLAQAAIDAVNDGRVKFYPDRYKNSYLDWLGEKRDWCISRQLWWGHRIPIWSKRGDESLLAAWQPMGVDASGTITLGAIASTKVAAVKTAEGQLLVCVAPGNVELETPLEAWGFEQDPDVLDTWFSSALWPHATLGWPDTDCEPGRLATGDNAAIKNFYPGSVLVTSRDIITLWVARMVLTGLYNMGEIPFHHVCIHPKVLDGFGQTMSKSKGNGVDPIDLIDKYGADGVRFTIASLAGETQDVRLPVGYECPHCGVVIPQEIAHQKATPKGGAKPRVKCAKCKKDAQYSSPWYEPDAGEPVARIVSERFEYGRNFCNKLWNAARFAMLNLEGFSPAAVSSSELGLEDRWILSRLATVTSETTELMGKYHFDAATRGLREFVWNEFCDWYLEMIKTRLRSEETKPVVQRVLVTVLDATLRLLHPYVPFITEDLWQRLKGIAPVRGLKEPVMAPAACVTSAWPVGEFEVYADVALEHRFERLKELIVAVRNVRGTYNIPPSVPIPVVLKCSQEVASDVQGVIGQFTSLAKADLRELGPDAVRPAASAAFSLADVNGYVPFEGLIDQEAELARQKKEAEKLRGFIAGTEKKLGNSSFVDKAPPEVVEEVRGTLANLQKQLASALDVIEQLSG